MRPVHRCPGLLLLVSPWVSSIAHAQPTAGSPDRRELIQRGVAARDAGDHAGALEQFRRASETQLRPGLRMSIAQEEAALGRIRDACESASRCVTEVQADLGSPESGRVMQGCASLVTTTCATLGRVRLSVPTPVPSGLRVSVEGRAVELTNGAAQAYVNPGEASVEATVAGRTVFVRSVSVVRGAVTDVTVEIPPSPVTPLVSQTTPAPAADSQELSPAVLLHPARTPSAQTASRPGIASQWWFWTGLSLLVVGATAVGLAAGGVFEYQGPPFAGAAYAVEAITVR